MKQPQNVNILIACEESQAECFAFRERGFNAFSCDIQPCKPSGKPEWHIHGDVSPFLHGKTSFFTADGAFSDVGRWHMIIAHPPCIYLCKVGALHLYKEPLSTVHYGGQVLNLNKERLSKLVEARRFFYECLSARAKFVAVENPIPMRLAQLPPPDCFIEPYWFGHKYSKKTLYWLRNLPPLLPEIINPKYKCFVTASRGKYRSRTFEGVAKAMARQWGDYILDEINNNHVKQ